MKTSTDSLIALRRLACIEATTLVLLLCIAVPLKHLAGYGAAVSVMGPIHGLAFLSYAWMLINAASSGVLNKREAGCLMLAAVIPFGGFFGMARLSRRQSVR